MADDLLSRLSAATGPSRELDAEIAKSIRWKGAYHYQQPPRYTESIDAALSGEDIIGTSEQSRKPGQPIKWAAIQRMPKGRMPVCAIAHTEAIARRLACLKARMEKDNGDQ